MQADEGVPVRRDPFVVRGGSIREARPSDAYAIAVVHTASWQTGYRDLLPADFLEGLTAEARVPRWEEILAGRGARPGTVMVAVVDHVIVGLASFGESRDLDTAGLREVYAIYVDPAWWGSGAATALMTAALQRLDASDIPVSLWVLEGNERAVRFYRRHGFVPDGATKPEVIGDADVVELRLVRPR